MENNLQEVHIRKVSPFVVAISILHFAISLISIVGVLRSMSQLSDSKDLVPFLIYLTISIIFVLLNLTAGIYLIKRRVFGWWASTIYFSSTIPLKAVLALGELASLLKHIQYGGTDFLSIYTDNLKISIYELVISLIILLYLFQNSNLNLFEIKRSKKYCIILLTVISISSVLFRYLLSVLQYIF